MPPTIAILIALSGVAVGSGGGGIIGAYVMLKRFKIEREQSETTQDVNRQSTDAEQFARLFPGGLGDAVKVFQGQARELLIEVEELRDKERENHLENMRLATELERVRTTLVRTERQLERTTKKLNEAEDRIAQLESERNKP